MDKTPVTVSGVSMVYPNGQTNFIYGDTVNYAGTPSAKTQNETPTTVTISGWTYTYYEKTGSQETPWRQLNNAPTDAGSYKLVVAAIDEDYEGEQEITFTIAKRSVELVWPKDDFTYNGKIKQNRLCPISLMLLTAISR